MTALKEIFHCVSDTETPGPSFDAVIEHAFRNTNEDDLCKFNFNLPDYGLSLRSATFIDGVSELRFAAHPKVPTITEGDVATIFRLVSEGKRPGFYYTNLPFTNPLHVSRMFTLYDPQWLRWTPVGKLLAEADWLMKCMHIGARSNDDKTAFEAWTKTSQLSGLATRLDFPKDGSGPTIMSCESASVEKSEEEILFPEDPKMKINDGCSSLYSEYATQIYQSIAYYDEPKFLKMQEIVKLILAVEWLYNEKEVRVSQEWIMKHTSKPTGNVDQTDDRANKPPYEMVPKPTEFLRPSSDVTVKTREAGMYDFLRKEAGIKRRYGHYDFGDAETLMFKEDGTPCPPQKCLKLVIEHQFTSELSNKDILPKAIEWLYVSLTKQDPEASMNNFKQTLLKELQQNSSQEVAKPMPALIDRKIEDCSTSDCVEVTLTKMICPCPPLAFAPVRLTTTMRASIDNYNMLYGGEDPNEPLCPEIPGVCEAIIPDVSSWDEFISEMTVPIPRTWQAPYVGIGEPSAWGGVKTSDFRVDERRMRPRERERTVEEDGVFRRVGQTLGVRAERIRLQGSIQRLDERCEESYEEFESVRQHFSSQWVKGRCPGVDVVYKVTNRTLEQEWEGYGRRVQVRQVEKYFHGTTLACDITKFDQLCSKGECGVCGISSAGLDKRCISQGSFQRFGSGFYLAPNSSKCHDYTHTCNGYVYRAMLLCDVYPGKKYHFQRNKRHLTGPPPGYDSVCGEVGEDLNYPELVVYDKAAVLPRYIIVYRK